MQGASLPTMSGIETSASLRIASKIFWACSLVRSNMLMEFFIIQFGMYHQLKSNLALKSDVKPSHRDFET